MNVSQETLSKALRYGLCALALVSLLIGAYGAVSPHGFYRHVLGVDLLGPYNQHLLSDIGGFYLGFAAVFAWAARGLGRELVRAVCAGFALTQAIHFLFHVTHLDSFSVAEAVAQTIGLGLILAAPVACFWLSHKLHHDGRR